MIKSGIVYYWENQRLGKASCKPGNHIINVSPNKIWAETLPTIWELGKILQASQKGK
jgi:hypothetical protein